VTTHLIDLSTFWGYGMWIMFGSKHWLELNVALGKLQATVERLETSPALTLPPVEIGSHERLQERVSVLGDRIGALASEKADINVLRADAEMTLSRLEDLESKVAEQTLAVAEGIERVDRAERRIKGTVKRARNELKARGLVDDGLEAEDQQIRDADGEGSDGGGLQPVPEDVGQGGNLDEQPSSIPGVPLGTLYRLRGLA